MNVFIDTNILIDLLTKREPFYQNAAKIAVLNKQKKIKGFIAAQSFADIFYILRKDYSEEVRRRSLTDLFKVFTVVSLDSVKIKAALKNTAFKDFEDCLQAECAAACRADFVVTRNVEDFAGGKVKAITPEELIKLTDEESK